MPSHPPSPAFKFPSLAPWWAMVWVGSGGVSAPASISLRRAPPPLTHFLALPAAWVGAVCAAGGVGGLTSQQRTTHPPSLLVTQRHRRTHTHWWQAPLSPSWAHFTHPPKLVQMLGDVSTALLASEPWKNVGSRPATRAPNADTPPHPDRPERCLKTTTTTL